MKIRSIINDSSLGAVSVKRHATACRIIFHARNKSLSVTVPNHTPKSYIEQCIRENRSQLLELIRRSNSKMIKAGDVIQTQAFVIKVSTKECNEIRFDFHDGVLQITCPESCDFENSEIQIFLAKGICKFLKITAGQYLLPRARLLAREKRLKVNRIVLSHGRKRLGKCTASRNIFLSYYLMFLPEYLIDYVIFHELAHLTEMNHGTGFHKLCDSYCNGAEHNLEKELKAFCFPIE